MLVYTAHFYFAPLRVRSILINPSVCASVCVSVYLSVYPPAYLLNYWIDLYQILYMDPLWPWLVPPQRRCATLCTSGFVDDVTFRCNGRDAERLRLTRAATAMNGVAIPGWNLMSMNASVNMCR